MYSIVAALDVLTIQIRKPRTEDVTDAKQIYNRKLFFDLLVQVVVSSDYNCFLVISKHAGRTHDSTALKALTCLIY